MDVAWGSPFRPDSRAEMLSTQGRDITSTQRGLKASNTAFPSFISAIVQGHVGISLINATLLGGCVMSKSKIVSSCVFVFQFGSSL